jgi:hypothetical protein
MNQQNRDNHLIATAAEIAAVDFATAPEGATGYRIAKLRLAAELEDRVSAKWIGDEQFDSVDAPVFFQPRGINAATYVYRKTQELHRAVANRAEATQAEADAIVEGTAENRLAERLGTQRAAEAAEPTKDETATQVNERELAQERQNYLEGRPRSWRPPGWAAQQAKLDHQAMVDFANKTPPALSDEAKAVADKPLDGELRAGENPMVGKVTGYRKLTNLELELVNAIKAKGEELAALHCTVVALLKARDDEPKAEGVMPLNAWAESYRWAAIGKTDLQTGLMALIRAVAAPGGF